MDKKHFLLLTGLAVALFFGCKGSSEPGEDPVKASISVAPATIDSPAEGKTFEVNVKANMPWRASCSNSWVSVSPSSGNANGSGQIVSVTVNQNISDVRQATVTFGFALDPTTAVLTVTQQKPDADAVPTLTIAEFKNQPDSDERWYRLTAEIMSISKPQYGDMYVSDGTGQLYVYGFAPTKGGSNNDFSKLGLKPGDTVTFVAHKITYSGSSKIVETKGAYYESHEPGSPLGSCSSSASQRWTELPATNDSDDGCLFITHPMEKGGRNYSVYYDTVNRVAKWTCYPYVKGDGGTGRNGDPYSYDPLLKEEYQPDLTKGYKNNVFGDEQYVRGHMVPSNDRSGRANYDVFFSTNIMPQSSALNAGVWNKLEIKAHNTWAKNCDTLYVVTGTYAGSSDKFVKDNSTQSRESLVPEGIYKAFLARLANGSYMGLGVYFDNKANNADDFTRDLSISIDELEAKVGEDFFVNLPDEVEAQVESAKPSNSEWWWN